MNSLIRRMADREIAVSQQYRVPAPRVRVYGDSESFSIQVGTGWEAIPSMSMDPWVRPRMSEQVGGRRRQSGGVFNMHFGGDDSSFFFNLDMDSLMVRMGKAGDGGGIEVFKGDPRMRNRVLQFNERGFQQFLDSAFQGKKRKMSKLDSLMNEMDKRERQRERMQKEKELPEPRR